MTCQLCGQNHYASNCTKRENKMTDQTKDQPITEAELKELEENLNLSRTIEAGSFYAVNVERWRSITDMLPRLISRIREQDEEIRRLWRLLEDVHASAMCDDGTCPICLKDPHSPGCVIECVSDALLEAAWIATEQKLQPSLCGQPGHFMAHCIDVPCDCTEFSDIPNWHLESHPVGSPHGKVCTLCQQQESDKSQLRAVDAAAIPIIEANDRLWRENSELKNAQPKKTYPFGGDTEKSIKTLREVCGEAYQMAGAFGADQKVLDNLSAASQGKPIPHETFLPVEDRIKPLVDALQNLYDNTSLGGVCEHDCGQVYCEEKKAAREAARTALKAWKDQE